MSRKNIKPYLAKFIKNKYNQINLYLFKPNDKNDYFISEICYSKNQINDLENKICFIIQKSNLHKKHYICLYASQLFIVNLDNIKKI